MAEFKKYLDIAALSTLVDQIKAEDAKVLQSSKDYSDSLAKNYDGSGSAATALANAKTYADEKVAALAEGAVANNTAAIAKLNGAVTEDGSVAKAVADAKAVIDAAVEAVDAKADDNAEAIAAINHETTGILAVAQKHTDDEVAKVQGEVDTLEGVVGTLPADGGYTSVVDMITKKTANIASDDTVGAIADRVTETEKDIAALEGLVGSTKVETQISNAIDALNLDETYEAKGAAAAVQGETTGTVKSVEDAVAGHATRLETLEGQITGLSGAMHFKGVKDEVPADVTGYVSGDVIAVGDKEYVFNGTAFVEFGDVSAEGERLTALETHKTAYEAKVNTLETEMDAAQADIAKKVDKTAYDAKVEALEGADADHVERIEALEAKFTGDASVDSMISDAKAEAIEEAGKLATAAETNAKAHATQLDEAMGIRVAALEEVDHSHANKELLDTYTQTEANLADAVAKKHEHSNLTVLDGITAAKVSAWDAAEGNSKTYADGLNTAMTTKVDGIDTRVGTLETNIATKAAQSDLDDAVERIAQNELDIAANLSAINSFVAITPEEVNGLFA